MGLFMRLQLKADQVDACWTHRLGWVKSTVGFREARMNKLYSAALFFVLMTLTTPANAGYDCESSIKEYNLALSDISLAMRRYSNCVSSSQGKNDCSYEFRRLKNAQSSFELAVSGIASYCGF
jgi:hypothetical protein